MIFRSSLPSSKPAPPIGLDANGQLTMAGIAFGLFAATLMSIFNAVVGYAAVCQLWAYTYETTSGTVLDNDIDRVSSKGGSSFVLKITYSYHVGKDQYLGRTIRYGLSTSYRTEARAAAAFPAGANVVVYYNPAHPSDAVLLRGLQRSDLWFGLFLLPFNLVFGLAGLGTILILITPAKWKAKWDTLPVGIHFEDKGILATLRYYSIPPWAAAIGGGGVTAFFMIFLVGLGDDLFDPPISFAIGGWCAVAVAATIVYWKVRKAPTLFEIDRISGLVTLRRPGQLPQQFAIADVANVTFDEVSSDAACRETACLPIKAFNIFLLLRHRDRVDERVQLHHEVTFANAHCMVNWMRDRLVAS